MTIRLFLIALLLFSSIAGSNGQTTIKKDKYDLEFRYSPSRSFEWRDIPLNSTIDATQSVGGKHPLSINERKVNSEMPWYRYPIVVAMEQNWLLPDQVQGKNIEISINSKCVKMDDLWLKVFCMDSHDNLIYIDSVDLNAESEWKLSKLNFNLSETKYLTIGLAGFGRERFVNEQIQKDTVSKLYLDRMVIKIDGINIDQISGLNYLGHDPNSKLDPKSIIDLGPNDYSSLQGICLQNKRIIGLGETVHGSGDVNKVAFEVMKEMVTNNNCKLVLLETFVDETLKPNLFVQNLLPDSVLNEIREECRDILYDTDLFIDFIVWLRNYNKNSERKVNILGTVPFINTRTGTDLLFDYLNSFYKEELNDDLNPILGLLRMNQSSEAYELSLQKSDVLRSIMSPLEYKMYIKVLEQNASFGRDNKLKYVIELEKNGYVRFFARDKAMWDTADNFIDDYLRIDESCVIYAHYGHLKKSSEQSIKLSSYPMGYFINQKYKDDYFAIGITPGIGEINSRNIREYTEIRTTNIKLPEPITGSFERLCVSTNKDLFFYPTRDLPYNIYSLRYIGNGFYNEKESWRYSSLWDSVEGFIFIRDSHYRKDNYIYSENYKYDKMVLISKIMKSRVKTPN